MKKYVCLLLAMLFILTGCQAEEPKPIESVDTEPVLVPGIMESGLLTAQPGNFSRSMADNDGDFAEIETGYYYMNGTMLHYADKENLDNWVPVCSDPQCDHIGRYINTCPANIWNSMFCKDGRIHFMENLDNYPHLYPLDEKAAGIGQFSMAYNGTDIRLEHVHEPGIIAKAPTGSGTSVLMYENGYILYMDRFEPDGSWTPQIIWVDTLNDTASVLMERNEERDYTHHHAFFSANRMFNISGDPAFITSFEGLDYNRYFYWIHEGKPLPVDREAVCPRGGYLSENILRCYRPNDGYYDVDLLTGEETKIGDVQFQDGSAAILQPNCIIESQGRQQMRLFDGKKWRDIQLPDEIINLQEGYGLSALVLCSDRILFKTAKTDYYDPSYKPMLYQVMLTDGELTMEYAGTMSLKTAY